MLSVIIPIHMIYDGIHRGFLLNYSNSKCVLLIFLFSERFQLIFLFLSLFSNQTPLLQILRPAIPPLPPNVRGVLS